MPSFWQKTLYYLGLVDEGDDDYPASAPDRPQPAPSQAEVRTVEARSSENRGAVPGRRVEPPMSARRRMSADPELAEAGVYVARSGDQGPVQPPGSSGEVEVIVARTFAEAQELADNIRDRRAVILDLRQTEPEMARRLVDFSSGLIYALDGTMRRVATGVILVSPPRVSVSAAEKARLAALGLYDLADY
jgi:cell division inhibitor SepF